MTLTTTVTSDAGVPTGTVTFRDGTTLLGTVPVNAAGQATLAVRENVGNHELIAIKCLSDRSMFDQWLRLGGVETLGSYGVRADTLVNGKRVVELQAAFHNALPQRHLRFFRDLKNTYACGDFFFVHAGAKPNVELSEQKESDLLWIRGEFLSSNYDFGKIIVHGHTPSREIEVRPNRINIDTGAFATDRLTCLVLEGESLSVVYSSCDA